MAAQTETLRQYRERRRSEGYDNKPLILSGRFCPFCCRQETQLPPFVKLNIVETVCSWTDEDGQKQFNEPRTGYLCDACVERYTRQQFVHSITFIQL